VSIKHGSLTKTQSKERERRVTGGIRASKNVHMRIERELKRGKYRQTET